MSWRINKYFRHKTNFALKYELRRIFKRHYTNWIPFELDKSNVILPSKIETNDSLKTMLDKLCFSHMVHLIGACIKIQRWYRQRRCSNDTDPITLERIRGPAFVLIDEKRHRYKFDPMTLYEYFRTSVKFENPLTRLPLSRVEILRLNTLVSRRLRPLKQNPQSFIETPRRQDRQHREDPRYFQMYSPTRERIQENKMSLVELYDNARRIKLQRAEDANYKEAEEIAQRAIAATAAAAATGMSNLFSSSFTIVMPAPLLSRTRTPLSNIPFSNMPQYGSRRIASEQQRTILQLLMSQIMGIRFNH